MQLIEYMHKRLHVNEAALLHQYSCAKISILKLKYYKTINTKE